MSNQEYLDIKAKLRALDVNFYIKSEKHWGHVLDDGLDVINFTHIPIGKYESLCIVLLRAGYLVKKNEDVYRVEFTSPSRGIVISLHDISLKLLDDKYSMDSLRAYKLNVIKEDKDSK